MKTVLIGGIEREVKLKYLKSEKILKKYRKYYDIERRHFYQENGYAFNPNNKEHSLIIPNKFFFWSVWTCLIKKGIWPFRKPYRTMSSMVRDINRDEYEKIISFTGSYIFATGEDKKQGNVNQTKK